MAIYRGAGGSGDATQDAASEVLLALQAKEAAIAAQAAAQTAETNAETAATNAAASAAAAATFNPALYVAKASNLSDLASASTSRTNLGLGSIATQASSSVAITGGSITGITDLAVADGGTGASDAPTARTNLGLGSIATQASNSVSITGGSITGITDLAVADGGTGASTAANARTNLSAAASGANSDITSLTGLTTPLSQAQGGTGTTTGYYGFKNRIINGGMDIAQRGTSFTSGANNNDAYVLDRFYILSDGNDAIDVTQTTTVPTGAKYSIGLDVETTNKKFGIAQIIENANCFDAIGGAVTLSFQAKVSATTKLDNVKCAIVAWSGTADSVTSDIISAWGAEGTNPTLIANATYENTPANLNVTTSFATYSVTANVDTASTSNIIVFIWSDVTDTTAGDFLYITNIQLEKGSTATSFDYRPYGTELALCQRYFCKTFTITTAPVANTQNQGALMGKGNCASDIEPFCTWQTPVEMRTTPTVTLYAISNSVSANNQWTNGSATATVNARAGGIGVGTRQIQIDNTGSLSGSAGSQFYIQAAATAEL